MIRQGQCSPIPRKHKVPKKDGNRWKLAKIYKLWWETFRGQIIDFIFAGIFEEFAKLL